MPGKGDLEASAVGARTGKGADRAALPEAWSQVAVARAGTEHGSSPGACDWLAEQAIALLNWFRCVRIRLEIRDDLHEAFLSVGCSALRSQKRVLLDLLATYRRLASVPNGNLESGRCASLRKPHRGPAGRC